jgi:hypothetical protein
MKVLQAAPAAYPYRSATGVPSMKNGRLSTILTGIAGEYFVAAELSRRGYVASVTLRNTRGIDVLASNADATEVVGIQVKTNQNAKRQWLLSEKAERDIAAKLVYVFVNLNGTELPEFYVVPREVVATYIRERYAAWLGTPGRAGRQHRETSMRVFRDPEGEYKDRWDLLGLGPASV